MALEAYRHKRKFEQTPEPRGRASHWEARQAPAGWTGRFVVQKHAARQLHYDLRLELDGVLVSWAVPKGPSMDPATKRLAHKVEDHPLEYRDFEGEIPRGHYGAGKVIVWDQGGWRWDPAHAARGAHTAAESLAGGKLHFALEGAKLRGSFVLVRSGSKGTRGDDWLLLKLRDADARPGADIAVERPESVITGRRIEAVGDVPPTPDLERLLGDEASRTRRGSFPPSVGPALPTTVRHVPEGDDWRIELKLDGVRALAFKDGDDVRLVSRGGNRLEGAFPELVRSLSRLAPARVVLDGEICREDDQGRTRFQLLQPRMHVRSATRAARLALESPVTFHVFDCLHLEGRDLRPVSLEGRRAVARALLPVEDACLRFSDDVGGQGPEFFRLACERGLEGVVTKRAGTAYPTGRTRDWLKVKCGGMARFVIGGFAEYATTARGSLGGLLLGLWRGRDLVFVGGVGTGFDTRTRKELRDRLESIAQPKPPFRQTPGGSSWISGRRPTRQVWVNPSLVCECRYAEFTDDGKVRHPSYRGLVDADPRTCTFPEEARLEAEMAKERVEPRPRGTPRKGGAPPPPEDDDPGLTNLDKEFWPGEGRTKGDLVAYYRAVSGVLLPHLEDRPMVMNRYPDGIAGPSFYQKDTDAPAWVRTVSLHSEKSRRDVRYVVVDDRKTLLYCVQLACISLSPWSSRVRSLSHPDFAILDLDPGDECPFEDVIAVARSVGEVIDGLGLRGYPKTSGATGIHIVIPLEPRYTYEQARTLSEIVARTVAARDGRRTTLTRALARRPRDRVYVDYLQNALGKTVASVYSVRERPGAPVSTPLRWEEVRSGLRPGDFTIDNVPRRVARLGDLWRPVIEAPQAIEGLKV